MAGDKKNFPLPPVGWQRIRPCAINLRQMQLPLDIHSHTPRKDAIYNVLLPADFSPLEINGYFSAGIHPKDAEKAGEDTFHRLRQLATHPRCLAIGESGADTMCGVPMFSQLPVFRRQAEIVCELDKPLIIHDVKAHDAVIALHKELNPRPGAWVIHGFRGRPSVAEMLIRAGFAFSFGEKFNPDTLRSIPEELIFAETDESSLPLAEIISRISEVRGKDMLPVISKNMKRLFAKE